MQRRARLVRAVSLILSALAVRCAVTHPGLEDAVAVAALELGAGQALNLGRLSYTSAVLEWR